jgi:hypothetical protein
MVVMAAICFGANMVRTGKLRSSATRGPEVSSGSRGWNDEHEESWPDPRYRPGVSPATPVSAAPNRPGCVPELNVDDTDAVTEPVSIRVPLVGSPLWNQGYPSDLDAVPVPTGHGMQRPDSGAPALSFYRATARIPQCPSCGCFQIDLSQRPLFVDFHCLACQHRWSWQPGHPWPATIMRPVPRPARPLDDPLDDTDRPRRTGTDYLHRQEPRCTSRPFPAVPPDAS